MFPRRTWHILNKFSTSKRCLHQTPYLNERQQEHPFWRTIRILSDDIRIGKNILTGKPQSDVSDRLFPKHVDVVIIGGGAIGSSIAYWLKERTIANGLDVVVIEKDPTVSLNTRHYILIAISYMKLLVVQKMFNCSVSWWIKTAIFSS